MEKKINHSINELLVMAGFKLVSWQRLVSLVLIPTFILIIVFQMQKSIALFGLDLHHDTLMFDAARRFINGQLPYKDFFFQYNLATVYFHGVALGVLGIKIASLKLATAFVYAIIAVLIYSCCAVSELGRWSAAIALVWSSLSPFYMPSLNGFHAWATVYMMAAVMSGALCLTLALKKNHTLLWSLLAGLCFNIAFWFKQVAGVQIICIVTWVIYNIVCPSLPVTKRRFIIIFFGITIGGIFSSMPFFFYLYNNSTLIDWWNSAFVFNGYFASSGNSSSGLIELIKNFFPIKKDLGYTSILWAVLPLSLLFIVSDFREPAGQNLITNSNYRNRICSLFSVLSFAGWFEFFPLAHSFHTQLFLAPMFVLLALRMGCNTSLLFPNDKRQFASSIFLMFTVAVLFYEAAIHLRGLYQKTNIATVSLPGEMPASGLKLLPDDALHFTKFYNTLVEAQKETGNKPMVPLSVDPLRALLPFVKNDIEVSKLGLDWTFANEIVEPNFNSRISKYVKLRQNSIYADSLIGIPGYIPVSLLSMPSPLTNTHLLYVPSADPDVNEPHIFNNDHEINHVGSEAFLRLDESFLKNEENRVSYSFIKADFLSEIPIEKIDQVHVTIIRSQDMPTELSKLMYERYLLRLPGNLPSIVSSLFRVNSYNSYDLIWPLEYSQKLNLAKLLIANGNLFPARNFPKFATTLDSISHLRPFFAVRLSDNNELRILWARSLLSSSILKKDRPANIDSYFLALPGDVLINEEDSFLYLQVVMKDKTTANYYIQNSFH